LTTFALAASEPSYRLFQQWLILSGVLVFGFSYAWQQDAIALVVQSDPSRLSLAIGFLFLAGCAHCGVRAWYLSCQLDQLRRIEAAVAEAAALRLNRQGELLLAEQRLAGSLPQAYLAAVLRKYGSSPATASPPLEYAQLTDVLSERARGPHELGWFVSGLLTKLGLLGTVIGFILMLASVGAIESFDVADVQQVLSRMSVGMSVALYTTLVGLSAGMLLGLQYLLLDRGADALVANTVHFAEVYLQPQRVEQHASDNTPLV